MVTPITPIPIDADAVTTGSLKALQGEEQCKVMDLVDKLRRTGLNSIINLPQLVVCGDQSSGKSSVLEAITEIPFPRHENLCTRFATQISLRRSPSSTVSIKITPDKNRTKDEQAKLRQFSKSIKDFSELPNIIESATEAMGIGKVGEANSRAFSRDVLSIDICGPDRPQLTLVDLPGLIHATNKAQSEADKALILDLVKEYMKNRRSIILAVVSAKNDLANQIITSYARQVDEKGKRTLGIITKPDYLREGTSNELNWIEVAQNKNIYLELGWHMLKNRADDEMGFTFQQRNEAEELFFSKGRYLDLPRECVGIDALRGRLSRVLFTHLKKELPAVKEEMDKKLVDTLEEIDKLGEKRSTRHEQRMMLINISTRISDLLKSATKGFYENPFFGLVNMNASVDSIENIRRFRAVIQYLNAQFAENMRLRGQKHMIGHGPGDAPVDVAESQDTEAALARLSDDTHSLMLPKPKVLTRAQAVAWVQKVMIRSRGNELPGNFNPHLISQLFWEQSEPWKAIAVDHINNVDRACKAFIYAVVKHVAPQEFHDRLAALSVDTTLSKTLRDSKEELNKIIADKSRHPMTYNHYFTTNLQKQRKRKHEKVTEAATKLATISLRAEGRMLTQDVVDPTKLREAMAESIEQNMENFSAEEALDNMRAYYKDEMKYFINCVVKQVVERHLVEPLPDIILSPVVVTGFTDTEVEYIAAEPPETTQQRNYLESRRALLEDGMNTFRQTIGGLKR
ncbi:P-loop containing nucleoside triphosphate hydrolase protein [Clohesyomyces aquaticus]|uniref:p-loop containing nucleoside triphosphate hydrolase protein n=1 Tax=Clohesyomyces aquaticus TaxID=1231657 RepID=A0A1Y2A968_9PLEO|nr:P-loop containing nucleoside triphosphate hydrolase protein [Clohesyomyces aquaticus]